MSSSVLILIGLVIGGALALIGIVILSIPAAAIVYVVKNVYPLIKRAGKWSVSAENFFALLVLAVLLLFLIIATYRFSTLILILIVVPLILFVPIELGVLVWLIRLIRRAYAAWRLWLVITYLRLRTRKQKMPSRPPGTRARRMPPTPPSTTAKSVSPTPSSTTAKKVPPRPSTTAAKSVQPVATRGYNNSISQEKTSMSWKVRLMLKMMSNKLVIKILSIPIVVKVLTKLAQMFISVTSLFKRKKKES
jgi:Ca2+/Na+ antiporter